eukprot:1157260-Pelagomonas_calceolata.AAC.4
MELGKDGLLIYAFCHGNAVGVASNLTGSTSRHSHSNCGCWMQCIVHEYAGRGQEVGAVALTPRLPRPS